MHDLLPKDISDMSLMPDSEQGNGLRELELTDLEVNSVFKNLVKSTLADIASGALVSRDLEPQAGGKKSGGGADDSSGFGRFQYDLS